MKKPVSNAKYCVVSGLVVSFVIFAFAVSAWAAAARTKIIIVVPHRILFTVALPVYIAQEKGFYRENNIDVDAVFTRGGGENVQAVVSGDAQIGLGTGTLGGHQRVREKSADQNRRRRDHRHGRVLVRAEQYADT